MELSKEVQSHTIEFGSRQIDFHLVFGEHDRFQIAVSPDLRVRVDVPAGKPLDRVLSRVRSKAPWIARQVRYFEQFLPRMPERQYVSGETILFLGRQYRLKVVKAEANEVRLRGRFLSVRTKSRNSGSVKSLVEDWYTLRAKVVFERRLDRLVSLANRLGIDRPTIRTRRMRCRWGSCAMRRAILLNIELVKAPLHCIDYVIAHELCHLRHRRHGERFYQLLGKFMPDWRQRKERLEQVVI